MKFFSNLLDKVIPSRAYRAGQRSERRFHLPPNVCAPQYTERVELLKFGAQDKWPVEMPEAEVRERLARSLYQAMSYEIERKLKLSDRPSQESRNLREYRAEIQLAIRRPDDEEN